MNQQKKSRQGEGLTKALPGKDNDNGKQNGYAAETIQN